MNPGRAVIRSYQACNAAKRLRPYEMARHVDGLPHAHIRRREPAIEQVVPPLSRAAMAS
jgi:hypothetical protein